MIRKAVYLLLFLLTAFGSYHLTVFATPYAVLLYVKTVADGKLNDPVYADVVTDKERRVVLPNPDFLYVVSGYDLRKGPVRISGNMPEDSYASVAFYASNTFNYFVINDRQTPDKTYDIIIAHNRHETGLENEAAQVIYSPSLFGVILMRILVTDESELDYLGEIQHSFQLEVLE